MRHAISIALLQVRIFLKNKGTLAMMFVMPLAMTLIFGLAVGGQSGGGRITPIAIADEDGSFASGQIVTGLEQEATLKVQKAAETDLAQLFADRKIEVALVIPKGFQQDLAAGQAPELQTRSAPGANTLATISPILRRNAAQVANDYSLARQLTTTPDDPASLESTYAKVATDRAASSVSTERTDASREEAQGADRQSIVSEVALGFTVMFVLMTVFMEGGAILRERQLGTWGRLLTTPTGRLSILSGYLISFFFTGMFQFGVLVGVSTLLFGISWGPLLPLTAMAAALVLCASGMGLFLAGIVKTPEQQSTVSVLVVVSTSMLGGVYWPLALMSKTMQQIGHLTPQAWAMDGLREVMLRGGSLAQVALPLTVLLGIALLFLTIGALRVRYD